MNISRRRYQFRIQRQLGQRLELHARAKGVTVSDAIASFVERGLVEDAGTELDAVLHLCSTLSGDAQSLLQGVAGLEQREGGRYRYVLGHLQQVQVMVTELLHIQRVLVTADRPLEYARAVDLARRQAGEDAGVYRASLAAGGAPARVDPADATA
jgi:hypothetical protein